MFGPGLPGRAGHRAGRAEPGTVYLPAGRDWYNYWTGEKLTGGQTVTVAAPIDQIPLFVRAGSIIPLGADIPNTSTPQTARGNPCLSGQGLTVSAV